MRHRTIFAALVTLVAAPLGAQDGLPPISWNGFVSQGFVRTTKNDLHFTQTTRGTFEFNEAALNFSVEPSSRLRIGAQLLSRDLGSDTNHHVIVDWAVGDYRIHDWLGVRVGRAKSPFGIYGVLRDADLGRPEIYPPESVYPEQTKEVTRAVDGGAIYGGGLLDGAGSMEYELFGGAIDVDGALSTRRSSREVLDAVRGIVTQTTGLRGVTAAVEETDGTMDYIYGAKLEWRPVRGLRLAASGARLQVRIAARSTLNAFQGPLPVSLAVRTDLTAKFDYYLFGAVEYQRAGLRLTAEQTWQSQVNTVVIDGLPVGTIRPPGAKEKPGGWYVQGVYRVTPRIQIGGYYSRYYPDKNDKDGRLQVAAGRRDFEAWDRDLTGHARFDVTPNFLVKGEVHRVDGGARLRQYDNRDDAPLSRRWTLLALKATWHF